MKPMERMVLLMMSVQDLSEAVEIYAKCMEDNGHVYSGYDVPLYHSKDSIKRRIVQMRQNLLMLQNEIDKGA